MITNNTPCFADKLAEKRRWHPPLTAETMPTSDASRRPDGSLGQAIHCKYAKEHTHSNPQDSLCARTNNVTC